MRIVKDKKCIDVLCNKCGNSCFNYFYAPPDEDRSQWAGNADGLIEKCADGSYGSKILEDCTNYQFSLCEKCCNDLFGTFKIPVKITRRDDFHPRNHIDYFDDFSKDESENFDYLNDEYFGEGSKYYKFKIGKFVITKSGEKGRIYDHFVSNDCWKEYYKNLDNDNLEFLYRKENQRYQVGFKWFVNDIDTGQIRYEILEEDEIA